MLQDIRFPGVVVTFNEAALLKDCLSSLHFCNELIVIDFGSTDNSIQTAKECGPKVYRHKRVIYAAVATEFGVSWAKNEWNKDKT